jgi:multidrug efflux pump subunit AcrA (membrane-fusion protein)
VGLGALAAAGLLIALSVQLYQARQEGQQLQAQVASLQHTVAQREEAVQAGQRELQRATETIATLQAELAQRQETLEAERRQREQVERAVASLQGEIAEREAALHSLAAPQVRAVRLAGLPPSPSANGQVLWNPAARTGVLLTSGLPPTPADRVYELWAIAGKEPVPAGIFRVDEAGHGFLRLPPLRGNKRVDKFAVTLEPSGGVPRPTGPMHLLGNL